jgi:hypothetical protein
MLVRAADAVITEDQETVIIQPKLTPERQQTELPRDSKNS